MRVNTFHFFSLDKHGKKLPNQKNKLAKIIFPFFKSILEWSESYASSLQMNQSWICSFYREINNKNLRTTLTYSWFSVHAI